MSDEEKWSPDDLINKGWTYRDLPRMTKDVMLEFIDKVKPENIKFLTFAVYKNDQNEEAVRGQILISPDGMKNLNVKAN